MAARQLSPAINAGMGAKNAIDIHLLRMRYTLAELPSLVNAEWRTLPG